MMAATYKDAGVDIEAGKRAVELMREAVQATHGPEVLKTRADFGGLFALEQSGYRQPVLVSATDGVGTKLKVAFAAGKHDTVGIDLVAMCVNDIAVLAARPLFFLDYFATGRLSPETAAAVVSGIAQGCRQAGCALIGGETAELPGFYGPGEYDLAGFAVGIVERSALVDGSKVQAGDALIGVASSGLHSNGYSLVRRVLLEDGAMALDGHVGILGCTLAEELLRPTRIYVRAIRALMQAVDVHGMAHITGGAFPDNVERIIPERIAARIDTTAWTVPPIFRLVQEKGNVSQEEMYRTFNMGVGLVAAVPAEQADKAIAAVQAAGEKAWRIGEVTARRDAAVELLYE
jgi:phosphoribosylformylglycinamidine cyclo-ligase